MTERADGICSGAKALAASSWRRTSSSIRQWRRSFGPPCTIRCPTAAGAGILESARSLAIRTIASRWLGMDDGLREQRLIARILCEEFTFLVADRLGLAGEQNFGPCRSDAVQSEFERRRAAVQRENGQCWFGVCHLTPGGKIELTSSSANRGPPACRHHARRHRACDAPSWSNSGRSPSAPDRRAAGCAGWRQRQVGSGRDY